MKLDHELTRSDALLFVILYFGSYCIAGIGLVKLLRIINSLM